MKYVRVGIALPLVLGLCALLVSWPAHGQQAPGALPPSAGPNDVTNPFGLPTMMGQHRDPEMVKLINEESKANQEVHGLLRDYKRTEDADKRGEIKTKLTAALAKQFDAQQKRRDLELARVEAQLKKLRELMKKRGDERKTIIDRRVDQLVRDAEGLGWAPPPGPSSFFPAGNNLIEPPGMLPQQR
jgi:hypothetical protein